MVRPGSGALVAAFVLSFLARGISAQQLAERIARVSDGTVRLSFATRADVCGDGTFIGEDTPRGFRMYSFHENGYNTELLEDVQPECRPGPLRLVISRSGNQVVALNAAVGVSWRSKSEVSDLGLVPAGEVAAWLLDLAANAAADRIKVVAFVAANAADSARIADRLLRIAKNRTLSAETRATAIRWLSEAARREGRANEADIALRSIIRDQSDARLVRERAVRELSPGPASDGFLKETYRVINDGDLKERIIRTVGMSHTDENASWIRSLILAPDESRELRDRALRTYGEELHREAEIRTLYPSLDNPQLKDRALRVALASGDSANARWLRDVAQDPREPVAARDRAIRVLAEAGDTESTGWLESLVGDRTQPLPLRDRALRLLAERGRLGVLQQGYGRLEEVELKERILRLVAERNDAGSRAWLTGVVLNAGERDDLRDRALRLLAEQGTPSADLVGLYDKVPAPAIRQRLVRILAERGDDVAVSKLMAIAEHDPDPDIRRLALRRLSETKNAKARAFLENRVLR